MDSWTQRFKSLYRREPVLSFVATAGAVNVAIGGLGEHWSLMAVGFGAVGGAIALGLRQRYRQRGTQIVPPRRSATYVLPPAPTTGLPLLSIPKKQPPGR